MISIHTPTAGEGGHYCGRHHEGQAQHFWVIGIHIFGNPTNPTDCLSRIGPQKIPSGKHTYKKLLNMAIEI